MAIRRGMELRDITKTKTSQTIKWEDLILKATRAQYGRGVRLKYSPYTEEDKQKFVHQLFYDAKNINPRQPEEISKMIVDVIEKEYANHCVDGESDSTCVKVVSSVGATEGHNYHVSMTKGVQWGLNYNVGLLFGLPQHVLFGARVTGDTGESFQETNRGLDANVGLQLSLPIPFVGAVGVGGSTGGSFQKSNARTESSEIQKHTSVEVRSHHEETVQIPPGKKVMVKMTAYRVKYKLEHTLECKIRKSETIRVRFALRVGSSSGVLTASQVLRMLPGFHEDDDYAYFTQDGEFRWTTDRTVVQKTVWP